MSAPASPKGEFFWPLTFRWTGSGTALPSIEFTPERLWQPIDPGWSFGNLIVSNNNSSAPDVEDAVVSRLSYGKQIGRLVDAVEALIASQPAAVRKKPAVRDFGELAAEVAKIKAGHKGIRLKRLRHELGMLKRANPAEWERPIES